MQFVAGLSLREKEAGQEDPENCWACPPLVFECKLKKGIVGALPFQACRAHPIVDTPIPI